jgi:hypothetical protein
MAIELEAPVTRTSDGEDLANTLTAVRGVVKIRFQIAPGIDSGLGIADTPYRILSGGAEIATGSTNAHGEVEVPLQPLLTGMVVVKIFETDFNLRLHPGLQAVTTLEGRQKRYDILGYMTGYQLVPIGSEVPDDTLDGTRTQQSIMNFQADANIAIDGTDGNRTRNKLTTRVGE